MHNETNDMKYVKIPKLRYYVNSHKSVKDILRIHFFRFYEWIIWGRAIKSNPCNRQGIRLTRHS